MGFEDIKDKGLLGNRGKDLLQQRERRSAQQSVETTKLVADMQSANAAFNDAIDDFGNMVQKDVEAMANNIKKTTAAIEKSKQAHLANVQKRFAGATEQAFSGRAVTEDITSVSRSSSMLGPSINMAQNMSTSSIEDQTIRQRAILRSQEDRANDLASRIEEPGARHRYEATMSRATGAKTQLGMLDAAGRMQRKLGIDSTSLYSSAQHIAGRVAGEQSSYQIKEDVAAGRVGSRSQVQEQLTQVSKQLLNSFKEFDKAIKSGSKEADGLGKQFRILQDKYQHSRDTLSEIDRGGGSAGMRAAAARFGMIGDSGVIAQAGAQGYRYNYVGSELAQTQGRIGMAQFTNQRFQDTYGASQGDMGALRRVMSDSFADQVRRGNEFSGREEFALEMEMAGKGLQLGGSVAGGMMESTGELIPGLGKLGKGAKRMGAGKMGSASTLMKGGLSKIGGPLSMIAATGIGVGASASADALQLNKMITDYRKNIPQTQTFLSAANQSRQLQDTLSMVDDFSSQMTGDYFSDITIATRGMGKGNSYDAAAANAMVKYQGSGLIGGDRARASVPMGDISQATRQSQLVAALTTPSGERTEGQKNLMRSMYNKAQGKGGIGGVAPARGTSAFTTTVGLDGGEQLNFEATAGGGDRNNLMKLLANEDIVGGLSMAGLDLKDIPKLVGMGKGALGKEFAGAAGINTLRRGGELARGGFMASPEQYLQARGAMSGVGGGGTDMETLMKNAVAAGMDSSKNIMEMVNATVSLSQTAASAGIDAVGGATEMLGLGIQGLMADGKSKNFAVNAARNSAAVLEGIATSKDLDIFNVMEFAQIRGEFGGASMQQIMSLQTASPSELRKLKKLHKEGKTKEADQMAIDMGLHGVLDSEADVDKALDITNEQLTGRGLGLGNNIEMEQRIRKKRKDGKALDPAEQSHWNGMTRLNLGKGFSGKAGYSQVSGGTAAEGNIDVGVGGVEGSGEDKLRAGAIANAGLFAEGMENFKQAMGGIEALGSVFEKAAGAISGSDFADSTKEAADALKAPLSTFGDTITSFDGKMNSMIDRMEAILGSGSRGTAGSPGNNNPHGNRTRKPGEGS